MKHSIALIAALALAPIAAGAQAQPPATGMPAMGAMGAPNSAQMATMQQMHAQMQQLRQQTRASTLAALTPQHRSLVANVIGQLALSANPDSRAAAQALDAAFAPAEKQAILNVAVASRTSMQTLMAQHRAAFEANLAPAERAQAAQRDAKMQSLMQSRPQPEADAGTFVLATLGSFGMGGGMHGMMMPGMGGMDGMHMHR